MLQVYIIGFLGALGIAHGCWVVFVRPNKKRITKTHNQIKIYKKNQKLKTKSKKNRYTSIDQRRFRLFV